MSVAPQHALYTIDEYLRLERRSNVKHEYVGGTVYAMAGGTPEHAAMAMRIGASLLSQLRGRPCKAYSSDLRVRVLSSGLDTYSDVTVVCGSEQRDREDKDALVNPIVLVEVLSKGTEDYDRGEKLDQYKTIPSLNEVVFVSYHEPGVEIWRRDEQGAWSQHATGRGATARLESVGCTLDVDEIYRDPLRPA